MSQNPEGDYGINKFLAPCTDGQRGSLIALKTGRKEAVILALNSSTAKDVRWGEFYHVEETNPREWPRVVRRVNRVPQQPEWRALRPSFDPWAKQNLATMFLGLAGKTVPGMLVAFRKSKMEGILLCTGPRRSEDPAWGGFYLVRGPGGEYPKMIRRVDAIPDTKGWEITLPTSDQIHSGSQSSDRSP